MRVLILADSCNPEWPSLPVVGFKLCRALGEHVEAVVVTQVRNRPALEKSGLGRCSIHYIDNEYLGAPLYKLTKAVRGGDSVGWTTNIAMSYPTYLNFEWEARRAFRGELEAGGFDLVHRVTPMSPTLPSPMARWSPVPFVIGPLNGGLKWPREFYSELKREREWLTFARGAYRRLPYHRATFARSAAILAAFRHTLDDLPAECRDRVFNVPEVGIDPELFSAPPARPRRERLTFLFVGRLVPYKCPDVALGAFMHSAALRRHRLRIVGEGPERVRLEALVGEHGLRDCVEFAGRRTQAEVGEEMRAADVFVFPSIRELGAGVVVEAMACGLPCVVVDYGAPGMLVDETRGVRLPLGSKDELTRSCARALEELAAHPERLPALGAAGSRHVLSRYTWDAKARGVVQVYEWVLKRRAARPTIPV
ncbi:MAG TPA: glycosyltransferase family 4 protein [Planctomycetota bacterium]|jgi:glycosyltransferase involved in cell wall biosynthesis|nr:glycosyltransferase family 4 protein [Planctomycetota bacterium]